MQRPRAGLDKRSCPPGHPHGLALPPQQACPRQRGTREQSSLVCRREGTSHPRHLISLFQSLITDLPLHSCSISQDWLSDPSISPDSFLPSTHASSSTNPSSSHPTSSTSTNALTPQARAALMKKHVVQPADPELAARGCPICKEPFKGEFSEDEEEWVWMNAVEEEGVIYHATCRHETKTNAGSGLLNSARAKTVASLALGKEEARSRQGSREASREKSPVVVVKMEPGMEEAAVGTGLKRKSVGEGEGDDEGAEEGKRAKLSPAPAEEAAKQE